MKMYWETFKLSQSHRKVTEDYLRILEKDFDRVLNEEHADISFLNVPFWAWSGRKPAQLRVGVWNADEALTFEHDISGIACVDAVITASEWSAEIIRQFHEKVYVVPHVIDICDALPVEKIDAYPAYALTALDAENKRKNIQGVVEIAKELFKETGVHTVIKHYNVSQMLGVPYKADGVINDFSDYTAREMAYLYDKAALYFSPHFGEGFGMALAEAAARGVPTFAPWETGDKEQFVAGACFYISEGIQKMKEIISNPPQRKVTRLPHTTFDAVESKMKKVLEEILK